MREQIFHRLGHDFFQQIANKYPKAPEKVFVDKSTLPFNQPSPEFTNLKNQIDSKKEPFESVQDSLNPHVLGALVDYADYEQKQGVIRRVEWLLGSKVTVGDVLKGGTKSPGNPEKLL